MYRPSTLTENDIYEQFYTLRIYQVPGIQYIAIESK